MPTPYEEISKNRASIAVIKADANLANDSNKLGGIDAEEYATKDYVKKTDTENSKRDQAYADGKVQQALEDAKGYADNKVENLDLTPYAKKTDLEAESENLKEHCEQSCATNLQEAKSYTDSAKSALTDAMDSMSKAMEGMNTDLSQKYNDLFQSVSDGKSKIAGAITDKGVETSATDTFDKMSENIRSIPTGGEEGLNTFDATATAGDIRLGKTAYARGEKLVGSFIPDTIVVGGTDTSDATATANDIRLGKTAYVNGIKITGALNVKNLPTYTGDVVLDNLTEIYSVKEGYIENMIIDKIKEPNTLIANAVFVKNADDVGYDCAVKAGYEDVTDETGEVIGDAFYIYSGIISNGYVEKKTSDTGILKYKYTKEDLGLQEKDTIFSICFGTTGYLNRSSLCLLAIETLTSGDDFYRIHFYPYDIVNAKIICENEKASYDINYSNIITEIEEEPLGLCAAKLNPYIFAYYMKGNNTIHLLEIDKAGFPIISDHYITGAAWGGDGAFDLGNLTFAVTDKLLIIQNIKHGNYANSSSYIAFVDRDEYDNYILAGSIIEGGGGLAVSDNGQYMLIVRYDSTLTCDLHKINIDWENHTITDIEVKKYKNSNIPMNIGSYYTTIKCWLSNDSKFAFILTNDKHFLTVCFDLETIDNSTAEILKVDKEHLFINYDSSNLYISEPNISEQLNLMSYTRKDIETLIGLKYKDNVFYTVDASSETGEILEKEVGGASV